VRVVFLTATLPQYRLSFHDNVRTRLADQGIQYELIFGQPNMVEAEKEHFASLLWGKRIVNRYLKLGPFTAVWQPALKDIQDSDLVILGQENRLLINYVLQTLRRIFRPKIALWGHGRNFQPSRQAWFTEYWKRHWATRCDWWFAYTEHTRRLVEQYGFPAKRITVFHNAIDTSEIRRLSSEMDARRLDTLRRRLGLGTNHIGVYVGGLYDHKRIDFLVAAAMEVRRRVPDFVLIVVGSGVDRVRVEAAAKAYPWICYLGPLFGREKVEILQLGRVFMMPGLTGLAILDCAAAGLPIVTTAYPFHSPEITYLESGRNGFMVQDWRNPVAYADAVVRVLLDDMLYVKLRNGAVEVGNIYTIERMVDCFSAGVLRALESPKY
jgi:glycosyltransferase involved in cell wall biosynthesis